MLFRSFVLSFVKSFKIIEENHHGLSHVISHGLGHDVFKRVSWVEPGKTHGLGHDGFENGYLG